MGSKVQSKTITYSERAFLKKLGLEDFIGVKGLCINGRYVTTIEDVKSIDVVLWEAVEEEEHYFKD
jgi:hypothetical protein